VLPLLVDVCESGFLLRTQTSSYSVTRIPRILFLAECRWLYLFTFAGNQCLSLHRLLNGSIGWDNVLYEKPHEGVFPQEAAE
jgi:hypothetical protein